MRSRPDTPGVVAATPAAEDDHHVFRDAVADAFPLRWDRVHHEPPPPPAIPRHSQHDERVALRETLDGDHLLDLQLEGGDEAVWQRDGLPRSVLRDLRRGRWVVQEKLDLHGMNRDEARIAVAEFLNESHRHGQRCVRIVHGKGLRSPGKEPVLKKLVQGWLRQRREVLAFCQARTIEGGAGALIVLLQSARN